MNRQSLEDHGFQKFSREHKRTFLRYCSERPTKHSSQHMKDIGELGRERLKTGKPSLRLFSSRNPRLRATLRGGHRILFPVGCKKHSNASSECQLNQFSASSKETKLSVLRPYSDHVGLYEPKMG